MRRDLQAMEQVPELRLPGKIENPGSSARGCYPYHFASLNLSDQFGSTISIERIMKAQSE